MQHTPTRAQLRIYDFIEHRSGNGIIDAVAGAGKTTTLMECAKYIPDQGDAVYCAFNKSIQQEIERKFREKNVHVSVSTIHSLGFQMLRKIRDFRVSDYKYRTIVQDKEFFGKLIPEMDKILAVHGYPTVEKLKEMDRSGLRLDWKSKNLLFEGRQYVHKITKRLLEINLKSRCSLSGDNIGDFIEMIRHFGIIPRQECDHRTFHDEATAYFNMNRLLLAEGNARASSEGIIDFTDLLYLPYKWNLPAGRQYGFVFVDECQDLSKAQVKVVEKYLRKDGRLLAVGDPYQAIYGFAGADCESFERVRKAFNCKLLELTDCFRCPKDVIRLAKEIRRDIEGFKNYPGKLHKIPNKEVMANIRQGDLVICRTRLPLRQLAMKLINKNFKVRIHHDELSLFIGDYKRNFTNDEMSKALNDNNVDAFFENAKERNRMRIKSEFKDSDATTRDILIEDEVRGMEESLDFLREKYFEWHKNTLEMILKHLESMLSSPLENAIRISTIHRAKGLESDRVFILDYDKLPKKSELEWEKIQERNLHYVALTRPKEELYLCDSQSRNKGRGHDEQGRTAQPHNNKSAKIKRLWKSFFN